jgi:hypothetical protein
MRKALVVIFEILVPPIIMAWLFLKYPEIFDAIIPWATFGWLWYLTWDLILERESVKLCLGKIAKGAGRMAWVCAFLLGGGLSIMYLSAIKRSLAALPDEHSKIVAVSPKPEIKSESPTPPPPTLLGLFNTDFPSVGKLTDDAVGIEWADGTALHVKRQVYLDFPAKNEFVGFYIPTSVGHALDRTYRACLQLANAVQPSIHDLQNKVAITGGDSGGVTTFKDLTFSGRVFLYHEDPLTNLQKAAIVNKYNDKQFDVQFRGPDYLGPAVIAWHQKYDAKKQP